MPYKLELVPSHMVDGIWHHVSDGLEDACLHTGGDTNSHYLWTECRSGRAFLMLIVKDDVVIGASVWRFENWAIGTVLRNMGLYGEAMKDWKDQHVEKIEQLAKLGNANHIATEGRVGLARLFPEAKIMRQLYVLEI